MNRRRFTTLLLTVALIVSVGYFGHKSERYMGANTRLIHSAAAGLGWIEIRKVYPRDDRYWIFGPEPYVYGYYITYTPALGVPPEATIRVDWPREPTIAVKFANEEVLTVYFDGSPVLEKSGSTWKTNIKN